MSEPTTKAGRRFVDRHGTGKQAEICDIEAEARDADDHDHELRALLGVADLAAKIADRLALVYLRDRAGIFALGDEQLDRSGNLLGWLRDYAVRPGGLYSDLGRSDAVIRENLGRGEQIVRENAEIAGSNPATALGFRPRNNHSGPHLADENTGDTLLSETCPACRELLAVADPTP